MDACEFVLFQAELFKDAKVFEAFDLGDVIVEKFELAKVDEGVEAGYLADLLVVENYFFNLSLP